MENQKNNKGVIVLLIILAIILSVLCVLFATGTISFKNSEVDNNEVNENQKNNNIDTGITVYQNGRIVDSSIINRLKGKYQGYDENKEIDDYILISDKISECKISSIEYFGGISEGNREIVAVKVYLFSGWRHQESENIISKFTIEFNVKEDNNLIANYIFYGVDFNGGYEIHPLSNSKSLYYVMYD